MVYQYSQKERIIMAMLNSLSNLPILPTLFLLRYYEKIFPYYVGFFSIIVSFMYHLCESLDIKLYLDQLTWHELDNISAIFSFTQMSIPLTKFRYDSDYIRKKNYTSFFITMLFQRRNPWDITNTLMPIFIDYFIAILQIIKYGMPEYNKKTLFQASIFICITSFFFFKGLDDLNDYLRIWHCLWHFGIGISSLYLIQIQEKRFIGYFEIIYIHFGIIKNEGDYDIIELSVNNNEI
jgi:hypothetical protein